MAVAKSAVGTIGTGGATGGAFGGTGFVTVVAGDSFLLAMCEMDTSTPGTVSCTWKSVAMTQIGAVVTTAAATITSIALFGMVSPASGNNDLTMTFASGGTAACYMTAMSFTGSATSTVANATTGYASAKGTTGTNATVTTAAAIPTTGMVVGWCSDGGNGFTSGTPIFFSGGTNGGENETGTTNSAFGYATGSGATMSTSGNVGINSGDPWAIQVVGVVVAATGDSLNEGTPLLFMNKSMIGWRKTVSGLFIPPRPAWVM